MGDIKFQNFWENILRRVAGNKDRLIGASVVLYYDDGGLYVNHCGDTGTKELSNTAFE